MKCYELIVIGAGPAGLSAAIEAAKRGMSVVVYDENSISRTTSTTLIMLSERSISNSTLISLARSMLKL